MSSDEKRRRREHLVRALELNRQSLNGRCPLLLHDMLMSRATIRTMAELRLEIAEIDGRQADESEREFAKRMAELRADVELGKRSPWLARAPEPDSRVESSESTKAEEDLEETWSAIHRAGEKTARLRSPEATERVGVVLARAAKAAGELAILHGIAEEQPEAARHPPARRPAVDAGLELIAAVREIAAVIEAEPGEHSEALRRAADRLLESVGTAAGSGEILGERKR